jgi:hypothetical protein
VPLTRAQLLMGNSTQGVILNDQVQGVREASPPDGITIDTDGTIHFDASTSTGTMKLNNPSAYNAYVWPTARGSAGQQLETDASGNLFWADADGIDWTQKGQLIVGTGVSTDALLNAGPNNRVLKTANGATTGLEWSELYVDVVPNLSGAAVIPWGTVAQRPPLPTQGYLRFNTDFSQPGRLEVFDDDGAVWRQLAYVEPKPAVSDVVISGNTSMNGAIFCRDFNINPGVTLTAVGGLFIFASGFVNIQGNILSDAQGPQGARRFQSNLGFNGLLVNPSGQGMGAGNARFPGQPYAPYISPTGSGGAGGVYGNTGPGVNLSPVLVQGSDAGAGGGSIVIRSLENIIVSGSILTSNGGNATMFNTGQSGQVCGSGGGSGGTIILDANRDITLNGVQMTCNGGDGGFGINNGSAGGGGGGGWIITQARYGVLNIIGATSRICAGGNAGPATASGQAAGGGGGSNGGTGGLAQTATQAVNNGQAGVISNFGSIYPVYSN